ncbi:hypothetical protein [Bathymodiolus platifrons methanotrophic gill symbiont]|uniref:hypothetical protein n=1 Tax=Bathymodiolus platifrons methanotrophic gill symbiont TaxID=113268 RepID=UPI00142D2B86|nr:hypothetical protein [Bathymodiolus platifrons methanotrophic gill symbiont]
MNTATKISGLPALTADLLQQDGCLVDNLFADLWKQMGRKSNAPTPIRFPTRSQYS